MLQRPATTHLRTIPFLTKCPYFCPTLILPARLRTISFLNKYPCRRQNRPDSGLSPLAVIFPPSQFTMAPKISPLTTKFLEKLHGILDDSQNDLLVWVDDQTWMITDKVEFVNNRVKPLFGIGKGEIFYRKLRAIGFVVEVGRGRTTDNTKQTVKVRCPENFRRRRQHLCRNMRSVRTDASYKTGPKRVLLEDGEQFRPCTCQCCTHRGLDGRERVWYAELMCFDCIDHWVNLQSSSDGTTEEYIQIERFFLAHLAKTEYR